MVSRLLTLRVNPVADIPVITANCRATITQNQEYNCSLSATNVDNKGLSWGLADTNTCEWAQISDVSIGIISGSPNNTHVGLCELVVNIANNDEILNSYNKSITINNTAPILTLKAEANNIDEDAGENLIFMGDDVECSEEGAQGATFSLSTTGINSTKCSDNGILSINNLTGELKFNPTSNYYGTCLTKIVCNDNQGSTASSLISILVNPVNDLPAISQNCATTIAESEEYNCTPSLSDNDGANDFAVWSLNNLTNTCGWANINSSTGQITGTPNNAQIGACVIGYKVKDSANNWQNHSINVNVSNTNPSLNLANITSGILEDSGMNILYSDRYVQALGEGYGDALYTNDVASGTKCSDHGTVVINSQNAAISYVPAHNYNGICNIKILFNDGNGGTASKYR